MVNGITGTGTLLGLNVVLNTFVNEYYCATATSYGFRVLVHTPNEVPSAIFHGASIPNGMENDIVVTPTISEATKAVRAIPKHIRQCLFEEENFLLHFL